MYQPVHIDWRSALIYMTRDPAWKQRVGIGGLLMFVMPPIGWIFALGYRSLVGNRLVDGRWPVLPPWRGNFGIAFRRGTASSGVIVGYLTPFLIAYWLFGVRTADVPLDHWRELMAFAAAVAVFPPLAIPTLPVIYGVRYEWLQFSPGEISLLLILFFGTIVLLPAAFLQVARHRRFRAAFNVKAALRLISAVPRLYFEAWTVSLAISAVSVVIVPLTPWLLFWSYLVISHLFLQVLANGAERAAKSERSEVSLAG